MERAGTAGAFVRGSMTALLLISLATAARSQGDTANRASSVFDAAPVKPSAFEKGGGSVKTGSASISCRNVSLSRLILEAYGK